MILLLTALLAQLAATPAFEQRVQQVIAAHAAIPNGSYSTIAAKLRLGQDPAFCSRRLRELLKDPQGDMFWMFPVTAIAYLGRDQLTAEAKKELRSAFRTYMPFRGDTENHWLMYYTSLYLMAQLYPGESGDTWYTGKSSIENLREAEEYLLHWIHLTTTKGQGEYDCTHYMGVYLLPLSYLAAWSDDEPMRLRARKMLDWVIADYAIENLNGLYVGAHARTDDKQVLEKWNGVSSDFGWLLFGLGYPQSSTPYYALFYSVASAHEPPEVIRLIATDRSKDYVHKERKRTRHRWRFHDERNGPVYKTTYMRRDYAVSSDQGGILQPIQQHSWDLTWAVPDPRGVRNTIFSLHPYSSPEELQTYFTVMPDSITESVVRSKKSYDSPDKFLGGSPFEQIFQDLDTVVALYSIPLGTRFPHINGFFSADLENLTEDASGWIFAKGGNAFIAYRPLASYEWRPTEGGRRLYSPHLKNGTILQAAAVSEFPSFAAFCQAIRGLPLSISLEPVPSVDFQSLRHHRIQCAWAAPPRLDNRPLSYQSWKMFDSPYMRSEYGSGALTLTHGSLSLTLDLNETAGRSAGNIH